MLLSVVTALAFLGMYGQAFADVVVGPPRPCPSNIIVSCTVRDGSCDKYSSNPSYTSVSEGTVGATYCYNPPQTITDAAKSFTKVSTLGLYAANFIIECLVAWVVVRLWKLSRTIVWGVLFVNLLSWPVFYTFHTMHPGATAVVLGEIGVWLFEGVVLYLLYRKRMGLRLSLSLSACTNLATIVAGFIYYVALNNPAS